MLVLCRLLGQAKPQFPTAYSTRVAHAIVLTVTLTIRSIDLAQAALSPGQITAPSLPARYPAGRRYEAAKDKRMAQDTAAVSRRARQVDFRYRLRH